MSSALNPQKRVKIHGITFTVRKINPLDYLAGAKALTKIHDVYESSREQAELNDAQIARIKEHYADVFMSGVVSVRCSGTELIPTRKQPESGEHKILVSHLITDWSLAEALYLSIIEFTYGKKKLNRLASPSLN